MRQKAVLFDLDGTLIDSRRDLSRGVNLMRADLGLEPLEVSEVTKNVGDGIRLLVERSLTDASSTGKKLDLDHAVELMLNHYLEHLVDETTLYPGVEKALTMLSEAGWALGVVTNKPKAPAIELCRHFGLQALIPVVIGGDSCTHHKPHPEQLYAALKELNATAFGSWIAGDNHTDLAAGRLAGLRRCFCTYGFGKKGDETFELKVSQLTELAESLC